MSWLVRRYVADRTDITLKSREQYEWAIPHIEISLGEPGNRLPPRSTASSTLRQAIVGLLRFGSAGCPGRAVLMTELLTVMKVAGVFWVGRTTTYDAVSHHDLRSAPPDARIERSTDPNHLIDRRDFLRHAWA